MNEARVHLWTFLDGKMRKCLRCDTMQHLVNEQWDPAAPESCSGN